MATLQDIADAVGVTRMTASRVLNGGYEPTRSDGVRRAKEIRLVAEQMGYRPNTAARSMRTGKFNCIALLSPMSVGGFLPATLLVGLDEAMHELNLHLSISDIPRGLTCEDAMPKLLREMLADGMLINYDPGRLSPELVEQIEEQGIPFVWINMPRPADAVQPDDVQGGRWATQYLLECGATRLMMVNHQSLRGHAHVSVKDREKGFRQAVTEAGMTPQVIKQPRDVDEPASIRQLAEVFRSEDRPDAVFAYESVEAGRVMLAAAYAGLRFPDDLQLIVTSDKPVTDAGLAVTTAQIPFGEIGKAAVEMLASKVSNPSKRCATERIEYQHLVVRHTTRKILKSK